ncbi:MAG: hypothetical protein ACR2NR_14760 [Solirubrobacteraceae bacterium]
MNDDWRVFRLAIWLAIIAIAMILLVNPPYLGAVPAIAAVAIAARIQRRHQR